MTINSKDSTSKIYATNLLGNGLGQWGSPRMSSRLRKCDATRQHTMTATRMTMFEPLAAARPAVGSSRSLVVGESHRATLKGCGSIITNEALLKPSSHGREL